MLNNIILIISVIFTFTVGYFNAKRFIAGRFASVKTVKAKVCDKYKADYVSKYPQNMSGGRFVVVFETKDERLSFDVSEFSYGNYRIKQRGTLKYKGERIISFK